MGAWGAAVRLNSGPVPQRVPLCPGACSRGGDPELEKVPIGKVEGDGLGIRAQKGERLPERACAAEFGSQARSSGKSIRERNKKRKKLEVRTQRTVF